ncbi:MAG: MFS transporter, partial [Halobacteria archaeon]|nr:MFS transporter [Halobacteria archaeon]
WRWVFYLSVPVGVAAIGIVMYSLEETTGEAAESVDYLGAFLLSVGVGSLLLGLQFFEQESRLLGGGLVAVGGAGLVGFYVVEKRAREPILAPSLFRDRVFASTNSASFLTSFVIFAAIAYVPLFVQSVRGGAGSAALAIFPISIGWSGTSVVVGRVVDSYNERL